ncbi:unnamed protein product [Dibothriocephalus latus]|uniref:Uncharacterized protein n=1 Tax=Dibothriocephalus latus TaxID=60516 RepID=A0A3P6RS33_DIBLA|nr:unnamed protein product [Dibothriocephalus latus]
MRPSILSKSPPPSASSSLSSDEYYLGGGLLLAVGESRFDPQRIFFLTKIYLMRLKPSRCAKSRVAWKFAN